MTAVLDYGVGNLHSLVKALERVGLAPTVVTTAEEVAAAERIVLPGVGAFGPAAARLEPLAPALHDKWRAGTPILGICLGMQLMCRGSQESPGAHGLGWLDTETRRLQGPVLPAIGWSTVEGDDPVVGSGEDHYFVHGYGVPVGPYTVATARHGGTCSAAVRAGSALGVQFHPEKSSHAGLALLARWGVA